MGTLAQSYVMLCSSSNLDESVYDRSHIFDIRPKPKFSFKKIRPSAEDLS